MATKDITDLQVCQAYVESGQPLAQWPYNILERDTGEPEKVCIRAMERAEKRGYIEYWVSLRSGWLTEKGNELLDAACDMPQELHRDSEEEITAKEKDCKEKNRTKEEGG